MTISGKFFLTQLNGLAATKTNLIGLYIETWKVPWTVFMSYTVINIDRIRQKNEENISNQVLGQP
jgi:hypothetical protein